jgi:hypothetical protein
MQPSPAARLRFVLLAGAVTAASGPACSRVRHDHADATATAQPEGAAWTEAHRRTERQGASGITSVVLRATQASKATVESTTTNEIVVSGVSTSFDAPDNPPSPGGNAGFVFKQFGETLLVTTRGEYAYIHLGTTMDHIKLVVPPGVEVTRELMVLNGDDSADLRPPGAPPRPGPAH